MNNFIHRKTVEVQYKQRAIQQQTAINKKRQASQSSSLRIYNSCNLANYTLYSVIITMPVSCALERSLGISCQNLRSTLYPQEWTLPYVE